MLLEDLPTETITQIFLHVPTIKSALALAATCQRLQTIFKSSRRLAILTQAADNQYGPIDDILQLVTHNASQPAHVPRTVPISDPVIRSIIDVGRVAARWEEIYPFKKWKTEYAYRRLLSDDERFIFRRALYRIWLYTRAFHTSGQGRLTRQVLAMVHERAMLLHNYNTGELAEMLDVHNVLRDVISNNICPSNGTIRRKFQKRYPDSNYQLLFNIHLNYPPATPPSFGSNFYSSDAYYNHSGPRAVDSKYHSKFVPSRTHEPGAEGWGDDVLHYYVVEDMLKLDPAQILHLRDNAPLKGQVEGYVRDLGDWFNNNGETLCQTIAHVMNQRNEDFQEIKDAVDDGMLGVSLSDLDR